MFSQQKQRGEEKGAARTAEKEDGVAIGSLDLRGRGAGRVEALSATLGVGCAQCGQKQDADNHAAQGGAVAEAGGYGVSCESCQAYLSG